MKLSIKIGRDITNDVIINEPRVSRFHAVITKLKNNSFEVKDLNSTNSTFVNGKRITEQIIQPGDTVHVGESMVDWQNEFFRITAKSTSFLPEKDRKSEITEKNIQLEQKNKDITDSIRSAKRLQEAVLPDLSRLKNYFSEIFFLNIPKDIVSGDFYWFTIADNKVILAVVDCTGHGVPGAFMSVLGNRLLDEIIIEKGIHQPSLILDYLDSGVKTALRQRDYDAEIRDGMDISLCSIDFDNNKVHFAGAYHRLIYIKNKNAEIIRGDKFSIGDTHHQSKKFNDHSFSFIKGETIYLFTDGYADQFGGSKGKKFMSGNFKKLLIENSHLDLKDQEKILRQTFEIWKGKIEQTDDILLVGIRF